MRFARFALIAYAAHALSANPVIAKPIHATIAELDVKIVSDGPAELKRNLRALKGKTYIVDGKVVELNKETNYAMLKGDGITSVNCEFDDFPSTIAIGGKITVRGILSDYSFGLIFDHCALEKAESQKVSPSSTVEKLKPKPQKQVLAARKPPPSEPMPSEPKGKMVCTPRPTGGEICRYVPGPSELAKPPGD